MYVSTPDAFWRRSDTTTTAADAGVTAYCDAELALETAGEPDIDFETMTPEQQAEAVKVFATDTLRPLVDDLAPNVPDELQDHLTVLDGAVTQLETTGDTSAFATPEVQAAAEAAHGFDLEAGDYIAVCFIPVGTTSMEGAPPVDVPPHFTQGMVQEFSVS